MGISAALVAGAATVGGAAISAIGANSAADTQAAAANQASATQMQMYQQTRSDLAPYMSIGSSALGQLATMFGLPTTGGVTTGGATAGGTTLAGGAGSTGGLTTDQANALLAARPDVMAEYQRASAAGDPNSPVYAQKGLTSPQAYANYWYSQMGGNQSYQVPTTATAPVGTGATAGTAANGTPSNIPNPQAMNAALAATPGYQFGLDQGVLALDRSAASTGTLLTGGQLQAVDQFGTNYAMQQAWAPYVSELNSLATSGQNAAAGVGTAGAATAGNVGTAQLAAGQATASGQVGVANGLSSALTNSVLNYQLSQNPSSYGTQGTVADYLAGGGSAALVPPY